MKDDVIQSVTQAYSENKNTSAPNRSRTYELPITISETLLMRNWRLVVAALGLFENIWHMATIAFWNNV